MTIKLTKYIKGYRWLDAGCYHFVDSDRLNTEGFGRLKQQGLPESKHYGIYLWHQFQNKKRESSISFYFDETSHLSEFSLGTKNVDSTEAFLVVLNAINDLTEMGWIEYKGE